MPLTSTCLMRLPTTSFSRSRLRVSTSGNSGIGADLRRLRRAAVARGRQRPPRLLGGGLLGLLLRPALARAARFFVDEDRGEESLGVVGALLAHLVMRQGVQALGRQLLQPGLVVLAAGPGGRLGD